MATVRELHNPNVDKPEVDEPITQLSEMCKEVEALKQQLREARDRTATLEGVIADIHNKIFKPQPIRPKG